MLKDVDNVFVITAKVNGFRVWFKKLKRVRLYYEYPIGWGNNDVAKIYYHVSYSYT